MNFQISKAVDDAAASSFHHVATPRWARRGLVLAAMAFLLAATGCGKPPPPSFHGVDISGVKYGRDFRLNDGDGRARTLADFKGKAVLLFFGFTQCPDVCPTALSRAAHIKQLLGADSARFQVLFVSIDPERDTPAMLKDYTAAFDPSFIGLSGGLQGTEATAAEFKVFYQKVPTGSSYTMDHSTISYVFDPAGKLRLVVRNTQTAEEVAADLKQILHPAQ